MLHGMWFGVIFIERVECFLFRAMVYFFRCCLENYVIFHITNTKKRSDHHL